MPLLRKYQRQDASEGRCGLSSEFDAVLLDSSLGRFMSCVELETIAFPESMIVSI